MKSTEPYLRFPLHLRLHPLLHDKLGGDGGCFLPLFTQGYLLLNCLFFPSIHVFLRLCNFIVHLWNFHWFVPLSYVDLPPAYGVD